MRNGAGWPRLSIVMPSFNQGRFLEEAMRSVLLQGYPNLEFIVVDGGSTDGSVDIIRKYAAWLSYWVSEPDRGQFHAINKGFARCTGEILAWLNSDDKYCPWSFQVAAQIFGETLETQWLSSRTHLIWDEDGSLLTTVFSTPHARTWFYRGWTLENNEHFKGWIMQEATFWRRGLWEAAGGHVDEDKYNAGDFELWARFWQHADLVTTVCPLAGWRKHDDNKTGGGENYHREAGLVLARYRRETIRHPLLVWLFEQLLRRTGRGGRRFGSRRMRVDFDAARRAWVSNYDYCI